MKQLPVVLALLLLLPLTAQAASLIVVEDHGGASALPYYDRLNPEPGPGPSQGQGSLPPPSAALGFPVRSSRLSPGTVKGRVINAPGLQPFFLVGDDELSRHWLASRGDTLRHLGAAGLAVNVANAERLATVRSWAPGMLVSPVSGDELASRLGLNHYPVLITPTALEQ